MRIYLAGTNGMKQAFQEEKIIPTSVNVLESFYSIQEWQINFIHKFNDFVLDSGAFTFLNSKKKKIDFVKYAEEYANFICENKIDKFFELDLDAIIGIKQTEKLRERIEKITNKQCIPVWHKNRGLQYYRDMCKDYNYVAIGGLALKEIPLNQFEKMFGWFINVAHKNKTKVHGLGYTSTEKLHQYHFDSVDSSTWSMGSRFGELSIFTKGRIERHCERSNGVKLRRLKNVYDADVHNFKEWIKFGKYAEIYL